MQSLRVNFRNGILALVMAGGIAACGDGTGTTAPLPTGDSFSLSATQIHALDSTAQVVEQANPANGTIKSLVDSTLLILSAGVVAQRLNVTTDLTTNPLFFVGVHRVFEHPGGTSWATWNIVGMDDPAKLGNVIEVSGFAQTSGPVAPTSMSGTIGDGSGSANGLMLQIASGGAISQWNANAGSVAITTQAGTTPCPNFASTSRVTCTIETVSVHFTLQSSNAAGGAGARQATLTTDAVVPTMRLTYVF